MPPLTTFATRSQPFHAKRVDALPLMGARSSAFLACGLLYTQERAERRYLDMSRRFHNADLGRSERDESSGADFGRQLRNVIILLGGDTKIADLLMKYEMAAVQSEDLNTLRNYNMALTEATKSRLGNVSKLSLIRGEEEGIE